MFIKIGQHWINSDKITHIKGDMIQVDGQSTEEDMVIIYFNSASLELRGEEAEEFLSAIHFNPTDKSWYL